ncbi:MAG: hypothetical protein ABFD44_04610 [Anaerolineaceae bacterium]
MAKPARQANVNHAFHPVSFQQVEEFLRGFLRKTDGEELHGVSSKTNPLVQPADHLCGRARFNLHDVFGAKDINV